MRDFRLPAQSLGKSVVSPLNYLLIIVHVPIFLGQFVAILSILHPLKGQVVNVPCPVVAIRMNLVEARTESTFTGTVLPLQLLLLRTPVSTVGSQWAVIRRSRTFNHGCFVYLFPCIVTAQSAHSQLLFPQMGPSQSQSASWLVSQRTST